MWGHKGNGIPMVMRSKSSTFGAMPDIDWRWWPLSKAATQNPVLSQQGLTEILQPMRIERFFQEKNTKWVLHWGKYLLRFQRRHPNNSPSCWSASETHVSGSEAGSSFQMCMQTCPSSAEAKRTLGFVSAVLGTKTRIICPTYSSPELSSQPWGQEVPNEDQGWSGIWRPSSLSLFFLESWGQFFFMRSLVLLPLVMINYNVLYETN